MRTRLPFIVPLYHDEDSEQARECNLRQMVNTFMGPFWETAENLDLDQRGLITGFT